MKSAIVSFLSLAALLGVASGLEVGPVRLVSNLTYISYGLAPAANRSLLECQYLLEAGEEPRRMFWEMWDGGEQVATYEWRPGSGGQATGRLKGMVNLTREDGDLQLTKLSYDLAGEYLCGVTLTNDQSKTSSKEEVLIVDSNGSHTYSSSGPTCLLTTSYSSPVVFPEHTLHAGMFSPKLKRFSEEVSGRDWLKTFYSNGSVAYSYNNITFKIDENTPEDATFKVEVGLTKADGTFIVLYSFTSSSPFWKDTGCLDVAEAEDKEVRYFPGSSSTCRGGRKNTTRVTMTCRRGFRPAGPVRVVSMRCNGTSLTWQPEGGREATFEDLKCVRDALDFSRNKADNGNPSFTLLFASLFSVTLLLFSHTRL